MRNASNTPSNTHFSTHSFWLVKIHMGPTKSCGSHINLVGPMWILTNQRGCIEKCVLEDVLLAFLITWRNLYKFLYVVSSLILLCESNMMHFKSKDTLILLIISNITFENKHVKLYELYHSKHIFKTNYVENLDYK